MANEEKAPNKFRQWCIDNNVTARKVAEATGISRFTVYSYFRGDRLPSRRTMKAMEENLGIDCNEMF